MQQITVYTLDGLDYIGDIQSTTLGVELARLEASSGVSSVAIAEEGKRTTKHAFEVLMNKSGARFDTAQMSVASVGGGSILGITKSGSINMQIKQADGSGWGDKDYCPSGIRKTFEVTLKKMVPIDVRLDDWLKWSLSATKSDRVVAVSIDCGSFTFTCNMRLMSAQEVKSAENLATLDVKLSATAQPSSPTGSGTIWAIAYAGDSLLSLVETNQAFNATTGVLVGTQTKSGTGLVESLGVTIEDGQILKSSGSLILQPDRSVVQA